MSWSHETLEGVFTFNVIAEELEKTSGRNDRLLGQIGVSTIALNEG